MKTKDLIVKELNKKEFINVDKLVKKLYKKHGISERKVKENLWNMLEEGVVVPDRYWDIIKSTKKANKS